MSMKQWKNGFPGKPKKCPCMHHSKFKGCVVLLPMHATDSTPDNTTGAMLDAYSVIQKTGSISDNLQNTLILTFCWWGQSTPADTPHLKAFEDARLQTLEQPGQWYFGDARLQNIVCGVCQGPNRYIWSDWSPFLNRAMVCSRSYAYI